MLDVSYTNDKDVRGKARRVSEEEGKKSFSAFVYLA